MNATKKMILTPEEEQRINKLQEERRKIAAEIRTIKHRAYNRKYYKPQKKQDTLVYTTFGKSCSELTPEEKKQYDAIRQAKRRERKKS
jgi:hypothetical protein